MSPVTFAEALLEAGAKLLQFRHKGEFTRAIYETSSSIALLCRDAAAKMMVNDRADVALTLGAGVHVGQDDLWPAQARAVVGPANWVGYSTHNEAQFTSGDAEPVDYLAFGPVYETKSKERPDPSVGVAMLARLRPLTRKPLVAIGGITLGTAAEVLAAGADSIAVISALVPDDVTPIKVRERMEEWLKATRR